MVVYDYIIVGGGVAGLYCGYRLQSRGYKCIVLEKEKRIGGRVWTEKLRDGMHFETGAMKLLPSHRLILGLIDELGFDKASELQYMEKNIKFKGIEGNMFLVLATELKKIMARMRKEPKEKLVGSSLKDWMLSVYEQEYVDRVIAMSGYGHVFEYSNAHCAMVYLKRDLMCDLIIGFKSGLSAIIERLRERFEETGGVVKLGYDVHDIRILKREFGGVGSRVLVTVPVNCARRIKGIRVDDAFKKGIVGVPLLRLYTGMKVDGKVIDMPYTHMPIGNRIQRMLQMGAPGTNFYQIIYASGKNADYWKRCIDRGVFLERYKKYMGWKGKKVVFNGFRVYYWVDGIHLWKVGYNGEEIWRDYLKTIRGRDIIFIGESYSVYQRWIESAIESADGVLKRLLN